jgi:hypothetical protein
VPAVRVTVVVVGYYYTLDGGLLSHRETAGGQSDRVDDVWQALRIGVPPRSSTGHDP